MAQSKSFRWAVVTTTNSEQAGRADTKSADTECPPRRGPPRSLAARPARTPAASSVTPTALREGTPTTMGWPRRRRRWAAAAAADGDGNDDALEPLAAAYGARRGDSVQNKK